MKNIRQKITAAVIVAAAQGWVVQLRMDKSLYEIKEDLAGMQKALRTVKAFIRDNAGNPGVTMEELKDKKAKALELQAKVEYLTEEIKDFESAEKAKLGNGQGENPSMTVSQARGLFFQAVLKGNVSAVPKMAYEQLGAIPKDNVDQGGGSNLLPTKLADDLILSPSVKNPLRGRMTVSNVTGLELPKLGFTVDDDNFLAKDGETAKEMEMSADKVSFGNFKMKLKAEVSDTIINSSAVNIDNTVYAALQSAQATKELKVIFAESPSSGEEHMSFYSTANAVKKVTGANVFEAITAAYADLEDAYTENAVVVMSRKDYFKAIKELSNKNTSFYGKQPEEILGLPVIFCDRAKKPIVGDLSYLQLNFNAMPGYDTDKDVDKGIVKFVLTHWYDIRFRMTSAFRIAEVSGIGG